MDMGIYSMERLYEVRDLLNTVIGEVENDNLEMIGIMSKTIDAFDLMCKDLEKTVDVAYVFELQGFRLLETQINKMRDAVGS